MKITVQTMGTVDLSELVAFTYYARKPEFEAKGIGVRQVEDGLREQIDGKSTVFMIARTETKLIGWMVLLPVSQTKLQINLDYLIDGRPVIDPAYSQHVLEKQLIQMARVWAGENDYQEIIGKLMFHGRALAEDKSENYESLGFRPEFVYVGMECDLMDFESPDIVIPEEISIGELEQASERDLRALFFEAFRCGDTAFFRDLTDAEIDDYFDSLGYQDALEQKGSIILRGEAGRLLGFSMVLAFEETTRHISCMCIHPEFQGKGLGKLMLQVMMQKIIADGIEKLTLGTEQAMRAYQLYASYGFRVTWGEVMYSLTGGKYKS